MKQLKVEIKLLFYITKFFHVNLFTILSFMFLFWPVKKSIYSVLFMSHKIWGAKNDRDIYSCNYQKNKVVIRAAKKFWIVFLTIVKISLGFSPFSLNFFLRQLSTGRILNNKGEQILKFFIDCAIGNKFLAVVSWDKTRHLPLV